MRFSALAASMRRLRARAIAWRNRDLARRFPGVIFGEGAIVRGHDRFFPARDAFVDVRAYLQCAGGAWNGYSGYIKLGRNSEIGPYCVLFGAGGITIGDNVHLGPHVTISANQLARDVRSPGSGTEMRFAPVVIEDNVLVGPGTVIGPGVTIGANAVIGPGSAVLTDVPPNSMAQGVPARVFVKAAAPAP